MDLSQIPSGPPPLGVDSNFVDPPTQAPVIKITISVLLSLMILFVSFRLYTKIWILNKMEISDYACSVATVAAVSYSAVIYYTLRQKLLGRHIWDVPLSIHTDPAVQVFVVLSILYGPTMFLAKLSILLLYLRIFQVDRLTRVLVYIALIWNAMLALAIMIGFGILCVPPPGQSWQLASQDHKCSVVSVLFSQITGAINVCSDLFIIGIPIPAVWNLQLRTSKKFGVIAIFAAGGLACLASLLSLVYRVKQYRVGDKTWTSATAYLLTAAEIDVGIMCSCMPSYTHYLRHLIDFFRSLRSAALRAKPAESNPFKRPSKLRFNRFNLQLVSDIEKTIESTARDDGDSNCHPSNTL